MRIVILTFGSRGDVQPYVALGLGLQRAGHAVRLFATREFEPFVTQYGLAFTSAGDALDVQRLLDEWGERFTGSGPNVVRLILRFVRAFRSNLDRVCDAMLAASRDADLLVASATGAGAVLIAKKLRIPFALAVLAPIGNPTTAFPSPLWPGRTSFGPRYNRATHHLVGRLYHLLGRYALNRWQQDRLGLPPIGFAPLTERFPWLYGLSEQLMRRPPDWPDDCQVTGHWFLDRPPGWQPPPDLGRVLGAGPPPVYVGFGSMVARDRLGLTHLVLEALARTGQRGILARGWGALEDVTVPDTVYQLREAPHDWLFPQMAAVAHHGGAGTTAAGLRAGVPTVVVPHFGDQFYWAWLVHTRGCGPAPIARKRLTADRLTIAVERAVGDETMRARTRRLGESIRSEDGVGAAVSILETIASHATGSGRRFV